MRRFFLWLFAAIFLFTIGAVIYVQNHPLVFNESFWQHAHCMKGGMFSLLEFADKNQGKFPYHPGGYGDALLLLEGDYFYCLTGPGYSETPFIEAKKNKTHLSEKACGRVYIQGLTTSLVSDASKVVLLFDKIPSPGGDHCHLFSRLTAPLGREVGYVNGHSEFIPETDWPTFAKAQVELLVAEGIPRAEAERLYNLQ